MIQFGVFECGCIGTKPSVDGTSTMVSDCRGDCCSNELFMNNNVGNAKKKWEPLDVVANSELTLKLSQLVVDGYKFREIKSLLK